MTPVTSKPWVMMNKPISVITTELLKPETTSVAGTRPLSATISKTITAISSVLSRVAKIKPKRIRMMPMTVISAEVSISLSQE